MSLQKWASMSLCWSANAKVYGKKNYPYRWDTLYTAIKHFFVNLTF